MKSGSPTRILMVLADDHDDIQTVDVSDSRTVAESYFFFRDRNAEVVFASAAGGFPAVAGDMRRFSVDTWVGRFLSDQVARSDIADTLVLTQVVVDDFDALVIFVSATTISPLGEALISTFLEQGKTVVLPSSCKSRPTVSGTVLTRSTDGDLDWAKAIMIGHDGDGPL